jgi:plastocyanin
MLAVLASAGLVASLILSSGSVSAASTTVEVGDIYFCDSSYQGDVCTTTVSVGDTVVWDFSGAQISHTVTACGDDCNRPTAAPVFDSGVMSSGGTYQFTFTSAGTFNYYCQIHAFEQRGTIVVEEASAATSTLGSSATPGSGGTPAPTTTSTGGLPPTGYGPQGDATSQWWIFGALAAMGATLLGGGALSYARRR